ncbi:hypothetical protein [Brevundimonas sp.]|uniref:hypothetical protein n=1 Tax=Brevundimonas sp. TaxID=1871086 RepID=UPI002FC5FCC7
MTKAKTLYSLAVSVAALVAAQGALAQSAPARSAAPTAQELTRALNSRPPQATAAPAPVTRAAPAEVVQNPVVRPAPVTRPATAASAVRPATQTQAPATVPAARLAPAASAPVARPSAPAQAQAPVPSSAPATAPVAPARTVTPAPRIMPLNSAAIAALPFRIDLKGAQIVERPAGPSAKVYSVRRGDTPLLMIYTGPQSDYPIYGGDQAEVAGRTSIIVTEGMRRRAVEHLFRREDAQPADIHVWLMVMDGADGELAEQIGQTVDPR